MILLNLRYFITILFEQLWCLTNKSLSGHTMVSCKIRYIIHISKNLLYKSQYFAMVTDYRLSNCMIYPLLFLSSFNHSGLF